MNNYILGSDWQKQYLTINSADRTSGTSDSFNWILPKDIHPVRSINVKWVTLPTSWGEVDSTNNTFTINDSLGDPYIVTLTSGVYSASSLATELETQLNALPTIDDFTVVFNSTTLQYTITDNTGAFDITGGTSLPLFGLVAPLTASASYTSTQSINLVRGGFISVKSKALAKFTRNLTSSGNPSSIFIIPSASMSAQSWCTYEPEIPTQINWDCNLPLSGPIDLELQFNDRSIVNTNGLDWTIHFEITLNYINKCEPLCCPRSNIL